MQNTGVYIPLKMYIGGLYIFTTEIIQKLSRKDAETDTNLFLIYNIIEFDQRYLHSKSDKLIFLLEYLEKFSGIKKTVENFLLYKYYRGLLKYYLGQINEAYSEYLEIIIGAEDYVINLLCVHGPSIRTGEYYRLLTGIFLHGSIFHLFFNCYSLYVVGSQIESFLGKIKYIIIYLFSGLCGSLLSITFGGGVASIGASGAIFGLMGALCYFGYYYRIYLGNVVKTQLIPLIILNLSLGFMVSGVDNAAHIGGLIGGVIMTKALGIKDKSNNFDKFNGWIIVLIFTAFLAYMGLVMAGK